MSVELTLAAILLYMHDVQLKTDALELTQES